MNEVRANTARIWNKYQTDLREIYTVKSKLKPIYPIFHYIQEYYTKSKTDTADLTVAEIGFGDGALLNSLSSMFMSVVGLDISPENLTYTSNEFSEKGIQNVSFKEYDVLKGFSENHIFRY